MTIEKRDKGGMMDSYTPGAYSGCGCGSRRYYTKAEIDEMLANIIDEDKIREILDQMFDEYIESGDLYELILSVIGDIYTKDEIDEMLAALDNKNLDTTAFTAYTASTEAWKDNMENCCDDVNGMIEYLLGKISDLEEAIDEITGSTPTPPGPDTGDTGDTPSSEMVGAVYRVTSTNETKILNNNNYQFDYYIYNGQTYQLQATNDEVYHTFAATGEQSVSFHRRNKTIGRYQFYNTPLVRITLPDDTTSIGNNAFTITLLTGITLPDSVTSVGMEALAFSIAGRETRNVEINFGSGLTSIGTYINPKSKGVQNIYFTSTTPPAYTGSSSVFYTATRPTLNIYVPSASVQAYKAAPGFSLVADRIQAWTGQ